MISVWIYILECFNLFIHDALDFFKETVKQLQKYYQESDVTNFTASRKICDRIKDLASNAFEEALTIQ